MKADSLQMVKVFRSGSDVQYVLPHFQREYAWEKDEWNTFLKDVFGIYEVYDEERPPEHFLGSLVVISEGTQARSFPVFLLVDGQQRLTTFSLFIAALERQISTDERYELLRNEMRKMLINIGKEGDRYFKLLPTQKYR